MQNNSTQREIFFSEHDLIVSMTDKKGNILYANDVFCQIAGYSREELIQKPHNIVRHEWMPKIVFKLLWQRVLQGESVYAFVVNKAKNGDYYWVKAFVTPVIKNGEIIKIASYRRCISDFAKEEISKIYAHLLELEKTKSLDEVFQYFVDFLEERGLTYDHFIDRLSQGKSVSNADAFKIDFDQFYIDHLLFKHNIIHAAKEKRWNTEVTEPCCCRFGKRLKELEAMPFAMHPSWSQVHFHHNNVHALMKQYLKQASQGVALEQLSSVITDVEENTTSLFEHLHNAIDTYR